jgi:hypothetical protein
MSQNKISVCMLAGTLFVFASYTSAGAEEVVEATGDGGSRIYELQDSATDTPPVNYRSNEDERYNNPTQHDAEMYAEQYERERLLKAQEDEQRLKDMDGFAAGAPYSPGLAPSGFR